MNTTPFQTDRRLNIGFVSMRFAGLDGVSLEAQKWAQVLERDGHRNFWFAGELDHDPAVSFLAPKAHFKDGDNLEIEKTVFIEQKNLSFIQDRLSPLVDHLERQLTAFLFQFHLDLFIVENVLSIPMQIPLARALRRVMEKTKVPVIAHHHDFYWERDRFPLNGNKSFVEALFPPNLPMVRHVVINSDAKRQLLARKSILAMQIPNVIDFDTPLSADPRRIFDFRRAHGIGPEDKLLLQPTRVVERKGIEHAIRLASRLKGRRIHLMISHEAGDEGYAYARRLDQMARGLGVPMQTLSDTLADPFCPSARQPGKWNLWDAYQAADFITYPSLCEGFGNAFLEAVYHRKPILINRYPVFVSDIDPLGFDLVTMDGELTDRNVRQVSRLLFNRDRSRNMVEKNYRIARAHFSYGLLGNRLRTILRSFSPAPIPVSHGALLPAGRKKHFKLA